MAKNTEINYPTQEWIDKWVDNWLDKHPNEKVDDFSKIETLATDAWWDNEVDHNRPTPWDLTDEQKKAVKSVTKTTSGKKKETAPKERKADDEKRMIIEKLYEIAKNLDENAVITKVEKEIDLVIGENHYTIGLTKHRPPKK